MIVSPFLPEASATFPVRVSVCPGVVGCVVGVVVGCVVGAVVGSVVGCVSVGFPTFTIAPRYVGLRTTGTLSPFSVTIRLAFALSAPSPITSNGIS